MLSVFTSPNSQKCRESHVLNMASLSIWQSFHEKFKALTDEELLRAPHNAGDRWLRAYVFYGNQSSECGEWTLSEGLDEGFRARFDLEATRAGIALGLTAATKPL